MNNIFGVDNQNEIYLMHLYYTEYYLKGIPAVCFNILCFVPVLLLLTEASLNSEICHDNL